MSKRIRTYRNFNDDSEFLGLSISDLFVCVTVFLVCLSLLKDTNASFLAILLAGLTLGLLVAIRKGKRRKIIRDSLKKNILGRQVYDPRNR